MRCRPPPRGCNLWLTRLTPAGETFRCPPTCRTTSDCWCQSCPRRPWWWTHRWPTGAAHREPSAWSKLSDNNWLKTRLKGHAEHTQRFGWCSRAPEEASRPWLQARGCAVVGYWYRERDCGSCLAMTPNSHYRCLLYRHLYCHRHWILHSHQGFASVTLFPRLMKASRFWWQFQQS